MSKSNQTVHSFWIQTVTKIGYYFNLRPNFTCNTHTVVNFLSSHLHKNGIDDPIICFMACWNIINRSSVGISSVHPLDTSEELAALLLTSVFLVLCAVFSFFSSFLFLEIFSFLFLFLFTKKARI